MLRRKFIQYTSLLGLAGSMPVTPVLAGNPVIADNDGKTDRSYWTSLLYKMAAPVLSNMSNGTLKKNMPVEYSPSWDNRDKDLAYMECFGRLMCGLAPWLALPDDNSQEGKQRKQLREWALKSYTNAVDPASPDFLLWDKEGQPLVDAAFLAQSFIRAPEALWHPLDKTTKNRYIQQFKALRRVSPPYNNWMLFAAVIEAFLLSINEEYDAFRIQIALNKMSEWYVGDGWYSDGSKFHFDYYNSFVIQPMILDIRTIQLQKNKCSKADYEIALKRAQRYSSYMERMISPEGTFPVFGRSITYRTAIFQPLTQLCLIQQLPEGLSNGQIRNAITTVMRRMFSIEGNFSKEGWLQLGFAGHQPDVADYYLDSGSMYLASVVFLPLGLPENHPFWTHTAEDWTSKKAWNGQPFKKDYAVDY